MPTTRPKQIRFAVAAPSALIAFVAAAMLLAIGGWQILQARDQALAESERRIVTLSRALADQAKHAIEAVDLTLIDAVEQAERTSDVAALRATLVQRKTILAQVRNIVIVGADGRWITDAAEPHAPTDSSDRPYFRWHRDHADRDLHVDALLIGRTTGKAGVPLTRRINRPDGSFGGLVVATLAPDYFERFYETVATGAEGTVALWTGDGRPLFRYPVMPEGTTDFVSPVAAKAFADGSGSIRSLSPIDGVDRRTVFQRVDGLPLAVSASISTADALASWSRSAGSEAAVLIGAAIALVLVGIGLRNHGRRVMLLRDQSRAADQRYRLLAENASDLIAVKPTLSGHRSYVSPSSRRLVGWEPDELAVLPTADFVHPEDLADLRRQFDGLNREAPRVISRHRVRHKAGHYLWVEAALTLMDDGNVMVTSRDMTARYRAEQDLAESEARYRLLADNSTDMVTQMDLAGKRLFVSPGSRDLLGYAPEDLVGTNPLVMIHPDDADGLRSVLADLAEGRRDHRLNVNRLRHRDGHWVWVEASLRRLSDETGRAIGFVAAIRNITDRRQAHEALQASEARYRILAETSTDVITQINASRQRQYVSPSCRHMFGFEPGEMIGLQPSASIHPDEVDDVRALAAKLFAGDVEGDRVIATYRTLHKLGHWIWVEASMNLVRDQASGTPLSLICSLRDVTARQEATRALERAREAAEHATRVKSDFVANMSHELRTPLTGILGIHDLLRRDPTLSPAQRRLVELANDAGTSLLGIVNDVLDFSKIEAGQFAIESIPFDLEDLVAGCCDFVEQGLSGKPVEIRTELDPALPRRLIGDPIRLRQVLLNLLTNAIKFTQHGFVDVRLTRTPDRSRLRVDVVDTGIGIPLDRLETLFDRFTQADTSMTRRYGGTGLGLAICRRLVNLMGGQIGIEPGTQTGAHFWFDLPIQVFDGALDPQSRAHVVQTSVRGHHLLLVEDNAINAEIIAKILESKGFAMTVVADGAAAVEAATTGDRFSLVLMDLQMPVMDGLSAAREIRRREASRGMPGIPIVGLTANAADEDAARCLAAGMNAHVAKPIAWPQLTATLDRLLALEVSNPISGVEGENGEPDLDPATLEELASLLGQDRLAEYLGRFLSDLPARVTTMMEADAEGVARQAHMLTSTAGQLGFLRLSRLALSIERETRRGSPAHLLSELNDAVSRASSAANATPYARAG